MNSIQAGHQDDCLLATMASLSSLNSWGVARSRVAMAGSSASLCKYITPFKLQSNITLSVIPDRELPRHLPACMHMCFCQSQMYAT